jgi:MFS family permease
MSATQTLRTIRTQIPARLDRLPWSRFHWRVVAALGTVWILDGLEVTIVGSIGARLTESGSGIHMTPSLIGTAAAVYVAGACLGALFFGQLTDRHGRKKLMMVTLGVYITATVLTGFAFAPWFFFLCRFFTGAGIGGEYSAVNSMIDELIPARNRGQIDITINGSYWVGSGLGGLASLLFLDQAIFATNVGWRLAFGVGALLGLLILLVRRALPESPRWLFIHGREQEAERIVGRIEADVRAETGRELAPPGSSITVRQRESIPFRELARVAWRFYPTRVVLGLSLFVGQAFLYNAVTFNLGTMLSSFFGVASGTVPIYIIIFAAGNFLGPLLLGRLFDTLGRRPMISGTYLASAAMTVVLAVELDRGGLSSGSFIALVGITFFFASAGASAAYLTVSEIFPMETRALAIALFYAVGTGLGGIIGPLLFGHLIDRGESSVAIGFLIGAVVMAVGGVAELLFGVRAERMPLENIAKPLTVADAEGAEPNGQAEAAVAPPVAPEDIERAVALRYRARAEEERSRAAEHRATAHALAADGGNGNGDAEHRQRVEQVLADIAELRANAFDERAVSRHERATAEASEGHGDRQAALERAAAALERAHSGDEQANALAVENHADERPHAELSMAASERAQAREQAALADEARSRAAKAQGAEAVVADREATLYEAWQQMHAERAHAHEARAAGHDAGAARHVAAAVTWQEHALAAGDRVDAARHRVEAQALEAEEGAVELSAHDARDSAARARDDRIRARLARRALREERGLRRLRPGPGSTLYSPGMAGTAGRWAPTAEQDLDREIGEVARALEERGPTNRDDLETLVGARYWGPGRFRAALREAVFEGRARRLSRDTFAPPARPPRQ